MNQVKLKINTMNVNYLYNVYIYIQIYTMKDKIRTSVEVPPILFETIKIEFLHKKFNFQKLVERSMYLYLKDEEFQKKIHNTLDTQI
mgnify:CR=1 FL=1